MDPHAGWQPGTQRLDLVGAGLTAVPPAVFALADSLEILDLSRNALTTLPEEFARLRRLRILFCSENQFTELPAVLGQLPALSMIGFRANRIAHVPAAALPATLRWLILTDNRLGELPAALGVCPDLEKLALAGNRLHELPATMAACTRLALLRISANDFTALPEWLATLPRLAWLAFGGNPLTAAVEAATHALPLVSWSDLTVGEQVGAGASGVVHRALQRTADVTQPVALKLFKGGMTSDGWASSELAAAGMAGSHPHLIGLIGRLTGHPSGSDGMTMPLIAGNFRRLADPPSLASCSRDVYPAGISLTLAQTRRLAGGVASAVAHLHARGLLHGDVYAHNLLWDGDGDVRLGDFGAASFMPGGVLSDRLQRVEVCALGHLLAELLARTAESVGTDLHVLAERCTATTVTDRPTAAEVARVLQGSSS